MARRQPQYRHHKPSGQAFIEIKRKRKYLGKYGTTESWALYGRLLAEFMSGAVSLRSDNDAPPIVRELAEAFLSWAGLRYLKNGEPTSETRSYGRALKPVLQLYGDVPVVKFGPLALITCRKALDDGGICRHEINKHVGRIRRVFKWGVSREIVPETTWRALLSVEGLRVGETVTPEPPRVMPVDDELVEKTTPFLTPHVAAMVRLQSWTGARPGEICNLRMADLKMTSRVWEYRPFTHKTQHHGRERVIFFGRHSQEILRPWLRENPEEFLFQPCESRAWSDAYRRANRKTPMTPSQAARKRKRHPQKKPTNHYSTLTYGHSIAQACRKHDLPRWHPNQLRHSAATRIRAAVGIEAARIILGHSSAITTEIYAEADAKKAAEVMWELS